MAIYRIVCTEQQPVGNPQHGHIVAVGVGVVSDRATQRLTKNEVVESMNRGNSFYTQSESTGRIAEVEQYSCTSCRSIHIRSKRDSVPDNNLDNLRICRWQ